MISVVILTKNEEKNIIDCLESISWVDEIIIVDDYSEDRTLEVVKNFPESKKIKIYRNHLEENFSSQRNFGLTKTTKEWVLFLDADERITKDLREEINSLLINNRGIGYKGFYISRKDVMWGKMLRHGESGNISLLRFAKRNSGVWHGKVHEQWMVDGEVGKFDNFILHYPHQTIQEFLKEINFYSTLRALELFNVNQHVSLVDIILYPKVKFILNYFFKLGFLDGIEGFLFAVLMSFHSFLVRGKLWILWKRKK